MNDEEIQRLTLLASPGVFFFLLGFLAFAEELRSFFTSSSVMLWSDWQVVGSNAKPVIFWGPLGINRTVNLNCTTTSAVK